MDKYIGKYGQRSLGNSQNLLKEIRGKSLYIYINGGNTHFTKGNWAITKNKHFLINQILYFLLFYNEIIAVI